MTLRNKILAATPLLAVFTFLLLIFVIEVPAKFAWMVFLMIPIMPYLVGKKQIRLSFGLFVTIIYIILGFAFDWWHPGWIIFLLIPVFHIFFTKSKIEVL
jgi:hypothetical protein